MAVHGEFLFPFPLGKLEDCEQQAENDRSLVRSTDALIVEFLAEAHQRLFSLRYDLFQQVIMAGVPSSTIIAASTFYIIGAIAGMFGRFYREANTRAAVDDYGLTTMRLFTIPLLSGLAGIGGAFITLILPDSLSSTNIIKPSDLVASSPQWLLAAAIFGLTPNLIIKSLQQKAEKYASNLKSSKSME
jgi:hypothetical protein